MKHGNVRYDVSTQYTVIQYTVYSTFEVKCDVLLHDNVNTTRHSQLSSGHWGVELGKLPLLYNAGL